MKAALAITRRVFHRWHQYRAGELPYALLAGLLQPVKERLRRVLEEAATSQKMAVGDNRGSSKDFVCQLVQRLREGSDSLRSFSKA